MDEKCPKVSIILPTRNGEKYLKTSIESCLNQTYQNIELIVVDDCSNDTTPEIIRSYQDARIKILRQDVNIGLPEGLNVGFKASTGDCLTWTSDDNYYDTKAIEVMVGVLQKHRKVGFVYSHYYRIDSMGDIIKKEQVKDSQRLSFGNYVGGCFLYTRAVYKKVGDYNAKVRLAEDYEYWLRVRQSFQMKVIPQFLYFYRNHDQSLSAGWVSDKIEKLVNDIRDPFLTSAEKNYLQGQAAYHRGDIVGARKFLMSDLSENINNGDVWRLLILCYLHPKIIAGIRKIKRLK